MLQGGFSIFSGGRSPNQGFNVKAKVPRNVNGAGCTQ
jgi:hypothetical protein